MATELKDKAKRDWEAANAGGGGDDEIVSAAEARAMAARAAKEAADATKSELLGELDARDKKRAEKEKAEHEAAAQQAAYDRTINEFRGGVAGLVKKEAPRIGKNARALGRIVADVEARLSEEPEAAKLPKKEFSAKVNELVKAAVASEKEYGKTVSSEEPEEDDIDARIRKLAEAGEGPGRSAATPAALKEGTKEWFDTAEEGEDRPVSVRTGLGVKHPKPDEVRKLTGQAARAFLAGRRK